MLCNIFLFGIIINGGHTMERSQEGHWFDPWWSFCMEAVCSFCACMGFLCIFWSENMQG